MSTSTIKRAWGIGCVLTLFLAQCGASYAGNDISRGVTFVNGQQVTASELNNLADLATISATFITLKPLDSAPLSSDYLLLSSGGVLYKTTLSSLVLNNTNLIGALPAGVPSTNDLFMFWSTTNGELQNATLTQLATNLAPQINPNLMNFFGLSNGIPVSPLLTPYSPAQPNLFYQTNAVQFLVWDTNGVPHSMTFSNMFGSLTLPIQTNEIPYIWQQMFAVNYYGTNSTGFTNRWFGSTNFVITNFTMTASSGIQYTNPTLLDTDTIPVNSGNENTNVPATLYALYGYMTNKNALPPYTVARIQFSGIPATETITNMRTDNGIITNKSDASNWTTPTAVSFLGSASQMPTSPQVQSNTLYYALLTNTSPIGFQLYTNYNTALLRTNAIVGNGVNPSATGTMYWLTNYTSFNADVIANVTGNSINTGIYDVYFRTPAANALYYMTGNSIGNAANDGSVTVNFEKADIINTNFFRICTVQGIVLINSPLNHVLVAPQ